MESPTAAPSPVPVPSPRNPTHLFHNFSMSGHSNSEASSSQAGPSLPSHMDAAHQGMERRSSTGGYRLTLPGILRPRGSSPNPGTSPAESDSLARRASERISSRFSMSHATATPPRPALDSESPTHTPPKDREHRRSGLSISIPHPSLTIPSIGLLKAAGAAGHAQVPMDAAELPTHRPADAHKRSLSAGRLRKRKAGLPLELRDRGGEPDPQVMAALAIHHGGAGNVGSPIMSPILKAVAEPVDGEHRIPSLNDSDSEPEPESPLSISPVSTSPLVTPGESHPSSPLVESPTTTLKAPQNSSSTSGRSTPSLSSEPSAAWGPKHSATSSSTTSNHITQVVPPKKKALLEELDDLICLRGPDGEVGAKPRSKEAMEEVVKRLFVPGAILEDPVVYCKTQSEIVNHMMSLTKAFTSVRVVDRKVLRVTRPRDPGDESGQVRYDQTLEYHVKGFGVKKLIHSLVVVDFAHNGQITHIRDCWNFRPLPIQYGGYLLRRGNAKLGLLGLITRRRRVFWHWPTSSEQKEKERE